MSNDPSKPKTAMYLPYFYEVESLELAKTLIVTNEKGHRYALDLPTRKVTKLS